MVMRLLGLVLAIAGGIFVWLGVQEGIATWQRMDNVEEVTAQIAGYDRAPAGASGFLPVARFTGPDGNTVEVRLPPVDQPGAAAGVPVRLVYPPGRPDMAQPGDMMTVWSPAAIPAIGGGIAVLLGLAWLTAARRRPEDEPRLPWYWRNALMAVSLGLCFIAWNEYKAVVDALGGFPRTSGEVVALQGTAPVVRYTTADGVAIDYPDYSVEAGAFTPGDRVTVVYLKSNPAGAKIERFWDVWGSAAMLAILGGGLLLATLYAGSIRKGKPKEAPEQETSVA